MSLDFSGGSDTSRRTLIRGRQEDQCVNGGRDWSDWKGESPLLTFSTSSGHSSSSLQATGRHTEVWRAAGNRETKHLAVRG